MVIPLIAAGVGAAASLASGYLQSRSAAKQNALQKEFAQKGIQWKVKDAQAAGINPLYALGAPTHSYTPTQVGDYGVGAMGQNISRAIDQTRTTPQRAQAGAIQQAQLSHIGLQNELLQSQIVAQNQQNIQKPAMAGVDGSFPLDGQPSSATALSRTETNPGHPSNPAAEGGANPSVGYLRTQTGYQIAQGKIAKERNEEDWPGSAAWHAANRAAPMFSSTYWSPPPGVRKPRGYEWIFFSPLQEYQLVKTGSVKASMYGRFKNRTQTPHVSRRQGG